DLAPARSRRAAHWCPAHRRAARRWPLAAHRPVAGPPAGWCRRTDPSPPSCVALHAARIGGGPAANPVLAGGGKATLGHAGPFLDLGAAPLQFPDAGLGQAAFDDQHAWTGGARPEREGEVLDVPSRGVDRPLQVHLGFAARAPDMM